MDLIHLNQDRVLCHSLVNTVMDLCGPLGGKFFDCLSGCHILKKDSSRWG